MHKTNIKRASLARPMAFAMLVGSSLTLLAATNPQDVVINEVDADQVSTDSVVFRVGMKQHKNCFFGSGNGQHLLTGITETAVIANRILR